jgi:hypothetical protein
MSDQPVTRPLPTQDNTTQKDEDKHPCLEREMVTYHCLKYNDSNEPVEKATEVLNLLFHFTGLPNEHRDKEQV